jgi:exopolysaccharide biosynthesis protein
MNRRRTFACALGGMLACFWLLYGAMGEEALPQMVPVTFPQGSAGILPENPKDNYAASESGYSDDNLSYHDDSLDIRLYTIRVYDTPVVVAFVQIADAAQMKTEQAKPYPSKTTVRVSEIAKRVKAVLAVNADWFTYHNTGIVYRNGELLRNRSDEAYDGLAIDVNGDFHIIRPMTEAGYAQITTPIANSFVFGPALVMDGVVQEIVDRKVTYKQRMAIGQIAPLCYVLVATDGPDQPNSVGLSVPQLAELMHGLGAQTAYNLDGGQSTSMLMHQIKMNGQNPKSMRAVGDILYFSTAIAGE